MILEDIQRAPDAIVTMPDDDTAKAVLLELGLLEQVQKQISLTPKGGTIVLTHSKHPTHWIIGAHFSGCRKKDDDGFMIMCLPKYSTTSDEANLEVQRLVEREGGSMSYPKWQRFEPRSEGRN